MPLLTSAVSAMQYYRVAMILCNSGNKEEHAAEVCGLAISDGSDPVMVNSYGPICFSMSNVDSFTEADRAGARWLRAGEQRREIVSRLLCTQKKTGWSVQEIIDRLEREWLNA